jgi:hypothetical protein
LASLDIPSPLVNEDIQNSGKRPNS